MTSNSIRTILHRLFGSLGFFLGLRGRGGRNGKLVHPKKMDPVKLFCCLSSGIERRSAIFLEFSGARRGQVLSEIGEIGAGRDH